MALPLLAFIHLGSSELYGMSKGEDALLPETSQTRLVFLKSLR